MWICWVFKKTTFWLFDNGYIMIKGMVFISCDSEIRREARKAFLAFPSGNAEPELLEKDAVGTDEFSDMSTDVSRKSGNTPVRNCHLIII